MNKTTELICAHSALAFLVLLSAGMGGVVVGLAPLDPTWTAAQVAQWLQQQTFHIAIGGAFFVFGGAFFWPFAAAVTAQMKRIEGPFHSLADTQLATSNGTAIAVMLVGFFWQALAFRPGATPASTLQLFNDLTWIMFVAFYPPAVLQCVVIGICILSRRNAEMGVYPRWLGFVNFFAALAFMPGALIPFFKTGPFAWNGIISFWFVAVAFFTWILLMWWYTLCAIKTAANATAANF